MSIAPLSPHDACTHTTLTHATQAYIKEQKWLDAVFDKYDTNKSGQLEKGQLIELLRRVSPGVEVSDADEAYVLDMVDLSNTGRSPLVTAYHAPLSTLHSLPMTRFPPYYLLLTAHHLPLTTCYLLRQHPPLRSSCGVRDLEERARVGQRT